MNVVDAIVLAAIVVFAWTGWRQGFVAGLLSFGGFLIGALAAALLLLVAPRGTRSSRSS